MRCTPQLMQVVHMLPAARHAAFQSDGSQAASGDIVLTFIVLPMFLSELEQDDSPPENDPSQL
jgi:hypothetical protein